MIRKIAKALRWLRLLDFDLLARRRRRMPTASEVSDGELVVVEDAGVQKWACFNCPGGCGQMISLSLNLKRRPRWHLLMDFWSRPTVDPSVHQQNGCGCHFWVKRGRVDWCVDGRPRNHKRGEH